MKRVTIDTQSKTLEIRCPTTDRVLTLEYDRSSFTSPTGEESLDQWLNLPHDEKYPIALYGVTSLIDLCPAMWITASFTERFLMAEIDGERFAIGVEYDRESSTRLSRITFVDASNVLILKDAPHQISFDIPGDGRIVDTGITVTFDRPYFAPSPNISVQINEEEPDDRP